MTGASDEQGRVRVDKWLWAARCFKTRSLATQACDAGLCIVDGRVARPATPVRPGMRVEVETAGGLRILEVLALDDRRGPADQARALFLDHSPPPPPRDPLARLLNAPVLPRDPGAGRPTKRDRRRLDDARRR